MIDHGTRFAVSVDVADNVELAVTEGEVEIAGPKNRGGTWEGRHLFAGDALRAAGDNRIEPDHADDLARLTRQLPLRDSPRNVEVVAGYQDDFEAGVLDAPRRTGGWRYLTNATSSIGDPSGYVDLLWQDAASKGEQAQYDANGSRSQPDASSTGFVALRATGGHPGYGRFQSEDGSERYAIAAFTVPKGGRYRIESGWLCRWEEEMRVPDRFLDLVVHVDGEPLSLHEFCDRSGLIKFSGNLGQLQFGSTIYLGVGPSGYAYNDTFNWGFKIVRVLEPQENKHVEGR